MNRKERLVVIGGVAAGMSAASSFKRLKPDTEAIVLEKDYFISYGACSLPYYIANIVPDVNDLIDITPRQAMEERGITVLLRHEVTAISPAKKEICAKNLDHNEMKVIPYDKLVIATGGVPVRPPLPGIELDHVFSLRTLSDGIAIKRFIDQWSCFDISIGAECVYKNPFGVTRRPMKGIIVGGGYIGMEMAESLHNRGLDVTVIEKTQGVLGNMDNSITEIVENKLALEKITLLKGTAVLGFEGENGRLTRVATDRGLFDADMVLFAIGSRANAGLAQGAGIELGAGGAIRVNQHLETNKADIFAAGDCAETIHLVTGGKTYIPLGTTANKQGRIAGGENAAGMKNTFDGIAGTAVTKIFDLEVARTGLSPAEAQKEGYPFVVSTINGRSRSTAYPAGKSITVTFIVEKGSGKLLGAQMAGEEGVAQRIDTLAACLYNKMTVTDVARLDLAYAPPYATVWDPILIAANVASKKLKKSE